MQRICLSLEKNKGNKNPHDDVYIYLREILPRPFQLRSRRCPDSKFGYRALRGVLFPLSVGDFNTNKQICSSGRVLDSYPSSNCFLVIRSKTVKVEPKDKKKGAGFPRSTLHQSIPDTPAPSPRSVSAARQVRALGRHTTQWIGSCQTSS